MNHPCHDWNKRMLPIIQNTSFSSCAWWLPLGNERFIINELVTISMVFFWTWCDEWCCRVQLHPSNRGRWFFEWRLFLRQAHHYRKWVSATCRLEWHYQSSKKIMGSSLSYIETQWFYLLGRHLIGVLKCQQVTPPNGCFQVSPIDTSPPNLI